MALYATNRFPGDGTTTSYEFNFVGKYIARTHVKVYQEDNATKVRAYVPITDGNFLNDTTLRSLPVTPVGSTLVIYRETPKPPLVDFVNGSRFTEYNLDLVARQGLFVAMEAMDAGDIDAREQLLAAIAVVTGLVDDATAAVSDATASALAAATTASTQAGIATDKAAEAAASAASVDTAFLRNRANHTGTQGASTIVGLTDWMANPAGVQSINGGQLAGMRNKIINGKMEIAKRGTTFGAAGLDGSYTLDRWVIGNSSAATFTVSQQLGVDKFQNCLRCVVGAADTSIAAGDQAIIQQNIEGFNAYDLIGTTFTISFWVRSSVTGTYCVALRNSGFDRSYILTYTINAVDTWEYKTVTVTGGLPTSGGTWNFTNGAGLRVAWTLASGTTFQTTAGAWNTGNFLGTSAQANFLAGASNTFQLTGVQLEPGTVATPFEHRPFGAELALCQRYYQAIGGAIVGAQTFPGQFVTWEIARPVPMRANPTNNFGSVSWTGGMNGGPTVANSFSDSITVLSTAFSALNTNGTATFILQSAAEP